MLKSPREVSGGVSLCNFAHNVLSQKTMFKVSNRNTRKRCLLISKITLKTSGQRHLTTSYLTEVIVQNHVLDSFCNQKSTFSSAFKFDVPQYLIHENSKCQHFFISGKKGPKTDKLFNLLPYIQRDAISVLQKLDILIFCNILKWIFEIWAEKG